MRGVSALLLTAAIALGGCRTLGLAGRSSTGDTDGVQAAPGGPVHVESNTYEEMVVQYHAALAALAWPDGVAPTPRAQTDTTGTYQPGFGAGEAAFDFQCAWGGVYLANVTSHPTVGADALERYASITKMPVWETVYSDPNTRKSILAEIAAARAGDPSLIRQFHRANCE